eukprot:Lithocolla_globosa_v1_NODE_458_length_3994_cov_10.166032.p2 type:complete len:177 gc:universal NODE_458_length_3994_cov_10.166032:3484-2954(-)
MCHFFIFFLLFSNLKLKLALDDLISKLVSNVISHKLNNTGLIKSLSRSNFSCKHENSSDWPISNQIFFPIQQKYLIGGDWLSFSNRGGCRWAAVFAVRCRTLLVVCLQARCFSLSLSPMPTPPPVSCCQIHPCQKSPKYYTRGKPPNPPGCVHRMISLCSRSELHVHTVSVSLAKS